MTTALTRAFEAHQIDNSTFDHPAHVQVAFELLNKYDFIDASAIYAKGIRALAAQAGAPDKFNLTITYAFMSLIAERMTQTSDGGFETFIAANPDIMDKTILGRWYGADRLHSASARSIFLLPTAA